MAARTWHGALFAVVAAALITQVVLVLTGGADANSGSTAPGAGTGTRLVRLFSYFTVQSNILVAAACAGLALRPGRDGPLWRVLRVDALLGIVITGLVFVTVLASQVHLTGIALCVTVGFHYVAPPATLLGWAVFGPRGILDGKTLLRAFLWPLAWIGYTFLHGAVTGWYPYPFLDAAQRGYGTALTNTALVLVAAALIGLLLKGLDRLLPGPRGTKVPHNG